MAVQEALLRAARLRVELLRHRGSEVHCPVCGRSFDRFRDDWNRAGVICWRCGSHERHRALWLLLSRRGLLQGLESMLHFAPEWALRRHLQRLPGLRYVTTDLLRDDVDLQLDITRLELPEKSFQAVLCSHVLEHVEDDAGAMRELHRVTRRDGWCLIMVPLDLEREETFEDRSITDPREREAAYWQHDHVRLYSADIGERLGEAGFAVERINPEEEFGQALARRCRIGPPEVMWLCRPR